MLNQKEVQRIFLPLRGMSTVLHLITPAVYVRQNKKIMDLGVATEKDIKDFFSMWWDEEKIKKMSTTEIIKKLKALNVTFEPQIFKDKKRYDLGKKNT